MSTQQESSRQVYEEIEDDDEEEIVHQREEGQQRNLELQAQRNSTDLQHKQHQHKIQNQSDQSNIHHLDSVKPQHYEQQQHLIAQPNLTIEENTNHGSNQDNSNNKQSLNNNTSNQTLIALNSNTSTINKPQHNITISITKTQKKGTIMSYYYVYIIEGHDNKGSFSLPRRFNEFYEMRSALVSRWPGCFIPSIPAKNALAKNDPEIIKKRTRYLNDFVNKIATLPHLYYGEQFQTLLRSSQQDISQTFSKWPQPTSQSIINKYRINFSSLAGKQLNYETQQKISAFHQLMIRNQTQLVKQRQAMKQLAQSHDRLIKSYAGLFSGVFLNYEKEIYSVYCQNRQNDMLYMNESEAKLQEHQTLAKEATNQNPFWLLYDMIRHQERDALAFGEVFETRLKYEQKKVSLEQKIIDNERKLTQLAMGKKPISIMAKSGTGEDLRLRLQQESIQLQTQKENTLIIMDIISAMIAYIQIQRYKLQKRTNYRNIISRICGTEMHGIQNLGEVWNGLQTATMKKLSNIEKENKQLGKFQS